MLSWLARVMSCIAVSMICCIVIFQIAHADVASENISVSLSNDAKVTVQNVEGQYCLFIPSNVDLRNISISSSSGNLWVS